MILNKKKFETIQQKIQTLPIRLNFKIGEVSKILSIPPYILRYWEKEFPPLNPQKFTNNQRLYTRKDIYTLLLIKTLLYEEKLSINGLRKHLPEYLKQMKTFFENLNIKPEDQNLESIQSKDGNSNIDNNSKKLIQINPSELQEKAHKILITLSKMKKEIKNQSV